MAILLVGAQDRRLQHQSLLIRRIVPRGPAKRKRVSSRSNYSAGSTTPLFQMILHLGKALCNAVTAGPETRVLRTEIDFKVLVRSNSLMPASENRVLSNRIHSRSDNAARDEAQASVTAQAVRSMP